MMDTIGVPCTTLPFRIWYNIGGGSVVDADFHMPGSPAEIILRYSVLGFPTPDAERFGHPHQIG